MSLSDMIWKPQRQLNGWRAVKGALVDGRLWETEELCQAYCDGLHQGAIDGMRELAAQQ